MQNIFKKSSPVAEDIVNPSKKAILTESQIIEQIHEAFFTEVDRLLESAKIMKPVESDKQSLVDKGKRLEALGFINSKEFREGEIEERRLIEVAELNARNAELVDAINYFSQKYPHYKFITEESVKEICKKYGLVYSNVFEYTGVVPDRNLDHIENFSIDPNDECFCKYIYSGRFLDVSKIFYIDKTTYDTRNIEVSGGRLASLSFDTFIQYDKCPLEIAAPLSDFIKNNKHVVDYQLVEKPIEVRDPVVLKPVFYKGVKHYLIVTAWGLEASDELVVNEKSN